MTEFLSRWMPPNAAEHGPALDELNALVHWLMLVLFVGWGIYFAYVLWRFRARKQPQAVYHGTHKHYSTWVEGSVAVVEIVLLAFFSVPIWADWVKVPEADENALQVRVIGEQFAWNVHYPGEDGEFGRTDINLVNPSNPVGLDREDPFAVDDIVSINQLHLPVDRTVSILLSSKDVIHSFALQTMRVKQDAIPGMEIPVHFKPVETNDGRQWEITCAQLCGLGHYRMRGFLTVETPAEFEAWLAEKAPKPEVVEPVDAGADGESDQGAEETAAEAA